MSRKPEVMVPLPPVLDVVLKMLREDRDHWVQYQENWLPVANTLQHTVTGVRVRIDNQYHAQLFIPEIGDFTFSGGKEITEAAQLIVTLGVQIRSILALRFLERHQTA